MLDQAIASLQLPYMVGTMHDPQAPRAAFLAGAAIHADLDAGDRLFDASGDSAAEAASHSAIDAAAAATSRASGSAEPATVKQPGINTPCVSRLDDWATEQWNVALEKLWGGSAHIRSLARKWELTGRFGALCFRQVC